MASILPPGHQKPHPLVSPSARNEPAYYSRETPRYPNTPQPKPYKLNVHDQMFSLLPLTD
ncbi:hypothetical protein C0991_011044 [Blastosporella zonata]|nr:hypothetical protein C0991_011044 [Blastosporella zonata]